MSAKKVIVADQHVALQVAVAEVLADSDSPADAVPKFLETLGTALNRPFGVLWGRDSTKDVLRCGDVWQAPGFEADAFVAECRAMALRRGQELPGTTWSTGASAWIVDLAAEPNLPRTSAGVSAGLRTSLAFPVVLGKEFLGAVELFSREPEQPDEPLLRVLGSLGRQLGLYFQFKQAEETTRLRDNALQAISEGVFITDPHQADEPISYANAAFQSLTGFALREIKGRDIDFLRGPESDPNSFDELRQAYRDGQPVSIEALLYHKDGLPFWGRISAAPVTTPQGKVTHFVGVLTDVTERRRFEDHLREAKEAAEVANQAKSTFLANMSHELRTPLNAVILYSELLQEELQDEGLDRFIPDLEKIRVSGKHLLDLVNGVLDLSKIEAGKMELSLETFDVAKMLEEVLAMATPLVEKKENRLDFHCDSRAGSMHADLTKVRQILFNLLSNASKFTESGTVSLNADRTARNGKDWLTFCVSDTGIGMTQEQIAKLFQPFTQADPSTTRKFGGTGLGLTITKRFCEMMGGTIELESRFGQGSTFKVQLPARVSAGATQNSEETSASSPGADREHHGTEVLVVDDDPNIRALITKFLTDEGIRAAAAADGAEGLNLAAKLHPAVIFLDVLMPRMDGWAVLAALKADPSLAGIPVVMLTVHSDLEMGFVLGAADYLTKPIDRHRLVSVLQRFQVRPPSDRVLIIEDDEPTRRVLRRTLERQNWSVDEAANGRVALEQVERQRPTVILLDLMMPEMDGFEFVRQLRSNPDWKTIPVVVLTSKDLSPEDRRRLAGNVERVLQKGTSSRQTLLSEIRSAVERHMKERADENSAGRRAPSAKDSQ